MNTDFGNLASLLGHKIDDDPPENQQDDFTNRGTRLDNKSGEDPLFRTVVSSGRRQTSPAIVASENKSKASAIWDDEEIEAASVIEQQGNDGRKRPDFEFLYKQALMVEDMYMNRGFKDSSSVCCEEVVLKIPLPGEIFSNVNLDVTATTLLLQSPRYKLFLDLPHKVKDNKVKASFDSRTETLVVTMTRDDL